MKNLYIDFGKRKFLLFKCATDSDAFTGGDDHLLYLVQTKSRTIDDYFLIRCNYLLVKNSR